MADVMIVDADRMHETPKAFQDYVLMYFKERTVLGKRVRVATLFLDLTSWEHHGRGFAPTHSIHLRRFTDGLKKDQSLSDWIRQAEGTYLWTFEGGYDSEHVTNLD